MRMGTRLKPISAAVMYLPGFAPDEDPLELRSIKQETSLALAGPESIVLAPAAAPVAAQRPMVVKANRKVWCELSASDLAPSGLGYEDRIELNLAALRGAIGGKPCTRQDLTRYTGWGAIPKVFDDPRYEAARQEMEALMGAEGYVSAKSSVNTSFFTPIEVCKAVWHWIEQAGFEGGHILEPSAGVGNLIGTMPKAIAERSSVVAIEKDGASAAILRQLYGESGVKVHAEGFEAVALAEGSFDLAISNVPFGKFGVPESKNKAYKNWLIHDYFFGKSMELVRPGGLIAFLTSRGTLDKATEGVRRWLAIHGDLVGAVRLPVETFKDYAGTEACVDLVLLRKRETLGDGKADWVKQNYTRVGHLHTFINRVFMSGGSGRVVGELKPATSRYETIAQSTSPDWRVDLSKALAEYAIPKCYAPLVRERKDEPALRVRIAKHKPGCYLLVDGELMMSMGHEAERVALKKDDAARVTAMLPLRETLRALVKAQVEIEDEGPLEALRRQLHMQYDAFVKAFGALGERKNVAALRADADFPLLMGLEKVGEDGKTIKADLFYRRTARSSTSATSAASLPEALQVNLAESGQIQVGRLAGLLGWSVDEVTAGLVADGLAFQCPVSHAWEPAFIYLSGDVKSKLAAAEAAGEGYAPNVTALKAVVPADIEAHEISIRLGATWIPADVYAEFASEALETRVIPFYAASAGLWSSNERYLHGGSPTYGTHKISAGKLFMLAMNQKEPQITDRIEGKAVVNVPETLAAKEKQQLIREKFVNWLWASEKRKQRIVRAYNDTMNRHVEPAWDGSLLTLPGFSDCVRLHQHQKDAIWRTVVSANNTLLAHCVGAGKTLTMVCAGMELRRVGKARKPMYVVPNHMLEQFAAEFLRAYPGASVLMACKEDLAKDRRKQLTAKIALWDWDAIIITHSSFEKITASSDLVKGYIDNALRQIEAVIEACDDSSRKEIEAQKSSLENKLLKLTSKDRKDDLLEFKELGVDMLFVDEAHLFKNVWRMTRMTRVAGLPITESQRAFDMLMKVREIEAIRGDRKGVVFATGTPVANSLAELWVMQNFLQHHDLAALGFNHFDSWAANFGEAVTGVEIRPDGGGYRVNTRFARFVNLPEVMAIFKQVADIKTKEMLNLPTPMIEKVTVAAKGSPALKAYVERLVERVEKIKSGKVKPAEDNMLAVTTDGRKAATDMRLVHGCDEPGSKINLCIAKIHKEWLESASSCGTQIVFLDLSTPGTGHWSLYDDIKDKLIGLGVPAKEVAFIHDAATDKAKEALFERVREGDVRVLIGSTSKMGVGTNVQKRLVALHHIDAPWRPADVEQREGRIERQGNLNASARVYRYVTEGSFDAYMWQTLETKAKFIAQVMSGGKLRTVEDLEMSALSYSEVKALASGNPLVIEKAGVDADLNRLVLLRKQWVDQSAKLRWEARQIPLSIQSCKDRIKAAKRDADRLIDVRGQEFFIVLDGKRITDRKEAASKLLLAIYQANPHRGPQHLGQYAGLDLLVESIVSGTRFILKGEGLYPTQTKLTPANVLTELLDVVREIETTVDRSEAYLEKLNAQLARIESQLNDAAWEHEAKFRRLIERQAEIDALLGIGQAAHAAFSDDLEAAA